MNLFQPFGTDVNYKSRPWTVQEEDFLRERSASGVDVSSISLTLDRSMGAVIAKMFDLGLKVPHKASAPK